MNPETDAATNVTDPDAQLVDSLARQVLALLVQRGLFAPVTSADGTVWYRQTQTFNRRYLHKRRRQG